MAKNFDKREVRAVFHACCIAASRNEITSIMDRECQGNEELRKEVEKLLLVESKCGNFLEAPPSWPRQTSGLADRDVTIETTSGNESTGSKIDGYKLLQQIGEGGFGIVYMAQQSQPVRRKVALKLIKPGMDSKEVIARFEAERQALAMMEHPNVARVLDGGVTETGRPFFVMELVHGTPVTEFCDANRLSNHERLRVFVDVCLAVQHAHMKGIIHRDIKPSNVLVTINDDKPMPKVIDFGVSKALNQPLTEKTMFTAYGQMVGTPLYMSPEQAQFSAQDVDVRCDIYSLGVLLYELLTGNTPFDRLFLNKSGLDEMRRIIREVDPPRPSVRVSTLQAEALSTVSDQRKTDSRKLSHSLKGEMDWIVMKALEKDRTRRYESARAFADDVSRCLTGEQVLACPPSFTYRTQKLLSRHRALVTTVAVVLLTLISALTWSIHKSNETERALVQEQQSRELAQQRLDLSLELIDSMYSDTKWLSEVPNSSEIREQYIERADTLLDRIGDDPRAVGNENMRIKLAKLSRQLAKFHLQVGDMESFKEEVKRSQSLLPDSTTSAVSVARGRSARLLSQYHLNKGDLAAAAQSLIKAEENFGQVPEGDPFEKESLAMLASSKNDRSSIARRSKESELAGKLAVDSVELYRKLYQIDPNNIQHITGLAASLHTLSSNEKAAGNATKAQALLLEAIALYPAKTSEKMSKQAREYLANHWFNLGVLYATSMNDSEAAVSAFEYSAETMSRLASDFPAEPMYWQTASGAYNYMGVLLGKSDLSRAIETYELALNAAERAMDMGPGLPESTNAYCQVLSNLALAVGEENADGAVERKQLLLRKSVEAAANSIEKFPDRHDTKRWLGSSLCNLANINLNQDLNIDEAIELYTEAADWLRQSLQSDPRPNYLIITLGNMVICYAYHPNPAKRDLDRAATLLEEMEKIEPDSPSLLTLSALHSLLSGQPTEGLKQIASLPPEERDEWDWLIYGLASFEQRDREIAQEALLRTQELKPVGPAKRLAIELEKRLSD